MATKSIPWLQAEIARLEALYDRLEERIERSGGIDYKGELALVQAELESRRKELARMQKLMGTLRQAVESERIDWLGSGIVNLLIEEEPSENVDEIAADFIENEVGHYDWMANWQRVKERENPLAKIQAYLDTYGIRADARLVRDEIERLVRENPGHWR